MKKIVAKDKRHLKKLIEEEMEKEGDECDLNFIDLSLIQDMSKLFENSKFNANISGCIACREYE